MAEDGRRSNGHEALDDARRFGLDAQAVAELDVQLRSAGQTSFTSVFPVNAAVVTAFVVGASQWRTALVATRAGLKTRFLGLDYAGVKVALEALHIRITPDLWAGLANMEQAAAAALNGE